MNGANVHSKWLQYNVDICKMVALNQATQYRGFSRILAAKQRNLQHCYYELTTTKSQQQIKLNPLLNCVRFFVLYLFVS